MYVCVLGKLAASINRLTGSPQAPRPRRPHFLWPAVSQDQPLAQSAKAIGLYGHIASARSAALAAAGGVCEPGSQLPHVVRSTLHIGSSAVDFASAAGLAMLRTGQRNAITDGWAAGRSCTTHACCDPVVKPNEILLPPPPQNPVNTRGD